MKHSRWAIIIILTSVLLGGCSASSPTTTLKATAVQPTATAIPSPTLTRPEVVVTHPELEVISPENINRLEQIASWGEGRIYDYAVSPDRSMIVVSKARGIYLYDSYSLDEIQFFPVIMNSEPYAVSQVNFSVDGQFILFLAGDKINIYEIVSKKIVDSLYQELNKHMITGIFLGPDQKSIMIQSMGLLANCEMGGGTIEVYSKNKMGWQLDYYRYECAPLAAQYTNSNKVYSFNLYAENSVEIFHVDTGEIEKSSSTHNKTWSDRIIYDVSPDEKYLAADSTVDGQHKTEIYDMKKKTLVKIVNKYPLDLMSSDEDGQVVWQYPYEGTESEAISRCKISGHQFMAREVARNGNLATIMVDYWAMPNRVELWDTATCTRIKKLIVDNDSVTEFNPAGNLLVTSDYLEIHIWDISTGRIKYIIRNEGDHLRDPVGPFFFSKNGKYLITGVMVQEENGNFNNKIGNLIHVYDAESGVLIKTIVPGLENISAIKPGPDENSLLIFADGEIHGWDILAGEERFVSPDYGVATSEYSDRVWVSQENRVVQMDLLSGKEIASYRIPDSMSIDTPYHTDDGNLVLKLTTVGSRSEFLYIDTTTGQMVRKGNLEPGETIRTVDQNRIYSVCSNGLIIVRDLETLQVLKEFSAFKPIMVQDTTMMDKTQVLEMKRDQTTSKSMNVSFFPKANLFYVSSSEGMFFGDMVTGEILGSMDINYVFSDSLTFSPDGRLIATAGDDGIIRLWGVKAE